ncbi:MAG: acyloxyacyl hydrolase [Bacteroidota bacterium]
MSTSSSTNTTRNFPKLSVSPSFGYNILNGTIPDGFIAPPYQSLDVRVGAQTTGKRLYQELWNYPEWGGGIYAVNFSQDTLFGTPLAAFAYVDIPVRPYGAERKWNYGVHLSCGLSGHFRTYDPFTNPRNLYLSTLLNTYLDAAVWVSRRLTPRLDARAGISLVHFSNGSWRQPNLGLNLIGPKVQLQYFPQGRPAVASRREIPTWRGRHGLFIAQAIGTKQLAIDGGRYFSTTTSLAYRWWSGYRTRWLAQLDLFYDGSNNSGEDRRDIVPVEDRNNPANYWSAGLFAGYEAVYNRWSLLLGAGVYVWRRYPYEKRVYQRFGLRYRVWRGLEVGVIYKGRSFGADYIEWTVGYGIF